MWIKDADLPFVTVARVLKSEKEIVLGRKEYHQFILTCSVESRYMRPEKVSLVWTDPCGSAENVIHVQYPTSGANMKPGHDFGICVPHSFEYIDPYRIVEWVELHRFLGVTEINVYYFHLSRDPLAALKYYEREGIMNMIRMPPLPGQQNVDKERISANFISLNDCMLRNMYMYKWLLVVDFDGIILPGKGRPETNYHQLMSSAKKSLKHVKNIYPISYALRHSNFVLKCKEKEIFHLQTYLFRFFEREEVSEFLHFPRSFTNPQLCFSLGDMNCEIPYFMFNSDGKKVSSDHWTFDVPQKIGLFHHYKEAVKGNKCKVDTKDEQLIFDPSAKKFQLYVQTQIKRVHRKLRLT